ncbi:unnamed protein product [Medioppia subpectinata]|uniref:Chitin-binding type-2 domain-containing protein n=1 Tax=Medioppia subpectinata TaxID=1979941 RepID=A0A7R9Q5N8_9ACAR|nr:unnamed protein product [Medioppia subpectinata]CAG2113683.1 unnamed protein product [Medioppia subpectinata]
MIRCSNGKITHRFTCGEGKVFNDITKACDDPKYVNCHKSVAADTAKTSPPVVAHQPRYEAPVAARLQSPARHPVSPFLNFRTTSNDKTREIVTTDNTRAESVTTESPRKKRKEKIEKRSNRYIDNRVNRIYNKEFISLCRRPEFGRNSYDSIKLLDKRDLKANRFL